MRLLMPLLAVCLAACQDRNGPEVLDGSKELPLHEKEVSQISSGQRVQVNVNVDITREQCVALIENYKGVAAGGQVSVHKPIPAFPDTLAPWCVYNFDEDGIKFSDAVFNLKPSN